MRTSQPNDRHANQALQRTRLRRHGTCFHHHLSTHHAGAAPHSAVAELGVVRRIAMSVLESPLPKPPEYLEHDSISLRFSKVIPGDATRGFVPYYHYRIFAHGTDIGHINLRVGNTEHVRLSAGHVGLRDRHTFPRPPSCSFRLPRARSLRPFITHAAHSNLRPRQSCLPPDDRTSWRDVYRQGCGAITRSALRARLTNQTSLPMEPVNAPTPMKGVKCVRASLLDF